MQGSSATLSPRLTKTNVFGLLENAVLTVTLDTNQHPDRVIRAGQVIHFQTEDDTHPEIRCLILDVESNGLTSETNISRITIRLADSV